MRAEVATPRSARIKTSSISASIAASSLRLLTRSAMAPPSEDEVRLSPSLSRRHQLARGAVSVALNVTAPGTDRVAERGGASVTPSRYLCAGGKKITADAM